MVMMVAAVARQSVQVGRTRATAVGVVLLAARRRVGADEDQPSVVDHGRRLILTLAAGRRGIRAALSATTTTTPASDQIQCLQALQVLTSAAGPRVRSTTSS